MPTYSLPDRIGSFVRDPQNLATYKRGRYVLDFHPVILLGFLGAVMFAVGRVLGRLQGVTAYAVFGSVGDHFLVLVFFGALVAIAGLFMGVAALFRMRVRGEEAHFNLIALSAGAFVLLGLFV